MLTKSTNLSWFERTTSHIRTETRSELLRGSSIESWTMEEISDPAMFPEG